MDSFPYLRVGLLVEGMLSRGDKNLPLGSDNNMFPGDLREGNPKVL